MTLMLIGLLLFLGTHSVRIVADPWRSATRERLGPLAWKGIYSLVSIAGFVAIVWGYGMARQEPVVLWTPPVAMRHVAALLTLLAFVLLAAAYVPGNAIKAKVGHPMVVGVKVWAFAHLLANGTLADLLLFGAFVAWAVLCFRASRARDRAAGARYPAGATGATLATVAVGVLAWAGFAFWAHAAWIGVRPFG
jgi:uncharacterized membrane protein